MAMDKYADAFVKQAGVEPNDWNRIRKKSSIVGGQTGFTRTASLDFKEYDPDQFLLTHCTIIASVDTEAPENVKTGKVKEAGGEIYRPYEDYLITPDTAQYVNHNGDAWERQLLLATYNTFIGAENYVEHVQIPDLSKGKVVDACARDLGETIYVDILVATNKKHGDLIRKIVSGQVDTLSMGCTIAYSVCTKCGNVAHEETDLCDHALNQKGQTFIDSDGNERVIAELCGHREEPESVEFIEASWVGNPAFPGAVCQDIFNPDIEVEESGGISGQTSLQQLVAEDITSSVSDGNDVDSFFKAASVSSAPAAENGRRKTSNFGGPGDDEEEDGGDDDASVFKDLKDEVKEEIGEQVLKDVEDEFKKDKSEQHPPTPEDAEEGEVDGPNESIIQSKVAQEVASGLPMCDRKKVWAELGKLNGVDDGDLEDSHHTLLAYYIKDVENFGKEAADDIHGCVTKVGSLAESISPEAYLAKCAFVIGRVPSEKESRLILRRSRCL